MYDNETKNQFIELRAEGLSLDAISSRLNVPRATLGRWHHESVEQIQRLRALQWHLLEEQIGQRLEDTLRHIAQRIQKWDHKLDRQLTVYQKPGDAIRVIRESRREYLQLRAILLAPLQPARRNAPCLTLADSGKRDKTRQNPDALDTTSLPANDLQQPEPASSHSDDVAADVRRQVTSPEPSANPSANVPSYHPIVPPPPSVAESSDAITAGDGSTALPLPVAAETQSLGENEDPKLGWGEGQTGSFSNSFPEDQPKIQNPQSKIDSPSSASPRLCGEPPAKKHKPYWLNGHYYENPEYPEHIARAMCARRAA